MVHIQGSVATHPVICSIPSRVCNTPSALYPMPGWRQVVYRGVQTADYVHMCTVLFSLDQSKNEKKAQAVRELTSCSCF